MYNEVSEPHDEIEGMHAYQIEMEGELIKMEVTKAFEATGGKNYILRLFTVILIFC